MPLAPTHFFVPYLLYDIFQKHHSKKKSFVLAALIGLAGAAPDLDFILVALTGNLDYHRLFSHSYYIPLAIFLVAGIFYLLKSKNLSMIFLLISLGWLSHLVLDGIFAPGDEPWDGKIERIYAYMDSMIIFIWVCWESFKRKNELRQFIVNLRK